MYLLIGDLVQVYTGAEEGARNILRGLCVHGLRNPLPPPLGWHFCLENKLLSNVISSNINLCPRPLWAVSIFQFLGACPFPFFSVNTYFLRSHMRHSDIHMKYPFTLLMFDLGCTILHLMLFCFARDFFMYMYLFLLSI